MPIEPLSRALRLALHRIEVVMAHDVIPRRDLELSSWCGNFRAVLAAGASDYGVAPADVAELGVRLGAFDAALRTALDPGTRTASAIALKNSCRGELRSLVRRCCRVVTAQAGVSAAQRVTLGLPPLLRRDELGRGVRVPHTRVPASRPLLTLDPYGRLRIRDEAIAGRTAKPREALGAIVLVKVGGDAPRSVDEMRYAGLATRDRFKLKLPPGTNGQRVWVMAHWVNPRGIGGPVSAAVGSTIAA